MLFLAGAPEVDEVYTELLWARGLLTRARAIAGRRFIFVRWRRSLQNALATVGEPYLHVGVPWLASMRALYGASGAAFILFHEIGHTVDFVPPGHGTRWGRELWADYVAGMLLAALGFDLRGAVRFLKSEADCTRCTTHPPAKPRIAAVTRGYAEMVAHLLRS